jgi:hypothetical protein
MLTYVDVHVGAPSFYQNAISANDKKGRFINCFSCQYNQTFLTSSPSTLMPTYVDVHVSAKSFNQIAI